MNGRIVWVLALMGQFLLPGSPGAQEGGSAARPADPPREEIERLERRIAELERTKVAQEEATRAIIRQAIESSGSRINNVASFGGVFEMLAGRTRDFAGTIERVTQLNGLEFTFDVQVDEWTLGNFVLQYNDGTNVLFPTTDGASAGVERIDLDTGILTIGDTQRFPVYTTFGRMILPFGISTGDPVTDVPTLEDPLTIEAFAMREDGVMIGFGLPTPSPRAQEPVMSAPAVRPRVLQPLGRRLGRALGYRPLPIAPPGSGLAVPASPPPPLSAGILFYHGSTQSLRRRSGWSPDQHVGWTVGYRTTGPRSVDVNLDYNSSIFDSQFLDTEYSVFLDQIGLMPGMAASMRAKLGPVGFVTEWNGAIRTARFTDDVGRNVAMRPRAWQLGMVYQFDWNSGVESHGTQGTYVALGYSTSRDLAGVTRIIEGEPTRIGAVPEKRFLLSAGEWVLDGLRVAVEYSHVVDYSKQQGGTGRSASGVFSMLTYDW